MPRIARSTSTSAFLHLILRGNNQQLLFEQSSDYRFFLELLEEYSLETEVETIAYCLMSNHVHLLIHDKQGRTPCFMQKLGISYSQYYNRKYDHSGHLFQNRYKSQNILSDRQFITAFRYILLNPEHAGIAAAYVYPWSSYDAFLNTKTFLSLKYIKPYFSSDSAYRKFFSQDSPYEIRDKTELSELFMEDLPKLGYKTDVWATEIIQSTLNISSGSELQAYSKPLRDKALRHLKDKGLSIRQISRLTGIGRSIVANA